MNTTRRASVRQQGGVGEGWGALSASPTWQRPPTIDFRRRRRTTDGERRLKSLGVRRRAKGFRGAEPSGDRDDDDGINLKQGLELI